MNSSDKILRQLVIKCFHINEVKPGDSIEIKDDVLVISPDAARRLAEKEELVKDVSVEIIKPGEHDRWTNSIMDIIPISTKVLGKLGEGITHTLTGVYVMLTGVDEAGNQVAEFGSSEGILKEKLYLNRAGTPSDKDYIISFNVVLKENAGYSRPGPTAAHRVCDLFVQMIRDKLKKLNGLKCTEKHTYYDRIRPGKKKVVVIKQVAGQGAMHDNLVFPDEPSGFQGGNSIIDLCNLPIILTPNEYRDGALRAMT